ncbi:MAG: AAA family ATPase [Neglectibacter timonensis]
MSTETKITSLELENIKRIKAVQISPTETGLTVIGGKNGQGKTSVLDAIMWILGGERYRPSEPKREGSVTPPYGKITLSNGLVVERKGKNSDLKVIDPSGNRAGQQLLNEFISQFALDLPKFMNGNNKEKADTLLQVIGVGDKLYELDQQEKELYNQRRTIGQIADQKKKYAAELPVYPDVPAEPISATELIKEQQEILATNGEKQRKRQR